VLGAEASVETRAFGVDGGPLLLSVKDAAAHLGISRGLMYQLLNRGEIESVRIGQRRVVSREAMNRFIETNSRSTDRP
jgi:excisionase family DNA binding protein